MTVFELMILKCFTWSALSGGYSKTCEWSSAGDLYATAELCQLEARKQVGRTLSGDAIYIQPNGQISSGTIIEDSKCSERPVGTEP
jgi:hypothetical protein